MANTPETPRSDPITDPVQSGLTGVDQSVKDYTPGKSYDTMAGNCCPKVPDFKRGTN